MLRRMSRRLLPWFRRSRASFALALCAWLLMTGMAWASGGCCEVMQAPPADSAAMAMGGHTGMHGMHHAQAAPAHPHSGSQWAPDCTCAHVPAPTASVTLVAAAHPLPARLNLPGSVETAPQPPAKPPLRPPSA